jgi:FkbM family methyltransferase
MLLFDIGANRGDATLAGLNKGYKVVAVEAAPKVYAQLVKNFIYNPNVTPLRMAVSENDGERIEFYEAEEDGLSTLNKEWLTDDTMPYAGKPYRTVQANTITIDTLAARYGEPDLIKIDVEGAEWSVLNGMICQYKMLVFEWTDVTLDEHQEQLKYLAALGYFEVGPQFIEHHLQEPDDWFDLNTFDMKTWVADNCERWTNGDWRNSNLRPTADVGMLWVR